MNLKNYISIVFLFITTFLFAQEAELTATVSKNKLGVNQRLRLEFTYNTQKADNFKLPNFKDFRVISGPSRYVANAVNVDNGNVKAYVSITLTFVIQPKRKGELTIPPASIQLNGKTLTSKPIKIIVTDAVAVPKDPNDPNYIADQNIHLVAELSKTTPYVGEGVFVEYRLYFSNNVGIYDNAVTEMPQYNGFWNQEIKRNGMPIKTGKYNGEQYRYAVLHKALLIPTKTGKLTIDPMKMDIVVAVPTGRGDFFGNAITRQIQKEFSSSKKIIQVKALPTEGKPDSFTGAVGDFDYTVNLSKNALKANESSQIKVQVSGNGNLKLFELPKIETPAELEVYQPERKEKVGVTPIGIRGSVNETYTVVPQYKGKYKIPSTEFSYFNPKDNQYHTITTNDLFVDVLEGKELPKSTSNEDNTVVKQNVKTTGNNFRYIQTSSSFKPIEKSDFFKSKLFYGLLLLPLLAIPIGIFIHKRKEEIDSDIVGNKSRKADKLARKYLSEAQKNLGKKEPFYESLERALHNYLKAKLGVETSDISREKITQILRDKNINNTTVSNFINVLKDCDFARYTPSTDVQMKTEYEKAKQIITQLDKQL